MIYTVKEGDTIYNIARRFGVEAEQMIADNEPTDPDRLVVGQTLVIIKPQISYRVKTGDTLYSIAQKYGVTLNQLWRNNPILSGGADINEGQLLSIVLPQPENGNEAISVNGYAYPSIDREVLRKTLPYLTYLTVFSYGITEQGGLIEIDDEEVIELARYYGVAPIMLISSLTEGGTFSNELASQVLSDDALQDRLIEEIAAMLARKRYAGIDVDFEYVSPENRQDYVDFISKLRERLEPLGYTVLVALAPKVRGDQPGLLYEGHDYRGLGEAANYVLLMTYEWGYTYGPAMAVSPENQVRRVVEYATSVIPAEKIFLGVPNYGYNWTLPYVAGESKAQSLSNMAAIDLASEKNARIEFDETASSPYFKYFERVDGRPLEHEVWFEDARTVAAALDIVRDFGLNGISIWNVMRYFPQIWTVINSTYKIRKVLG